MTDPRAAMAARNNADLCAAACAAHGVPTRRDAALFETLAPPPPLFPEIVTLVPGTSVPRAGARAAIKDSFADLDPADLESFGLVPLFDASWLWRAPGDAPSDWVRAATPAALAGWEAAWAAAGGGATGPVRQFPDALGARPDTVFLGRRDGARWTEGAMATRSRDCIGLSNLFGPPGALARAADAVAALAPDRPVVGYEGGDRRAEARAAGFAAVGPLRVWVAPTPPPG